MKQLIREKRGYEPAPLRRDTRIDADVDTNRIGAVIDVVVEVAVAVQIAVAVAVQVGGNLRLGLTLALQAQLALAFALALTLILILIVWIVPIRNRHDVSPQDRIRLIRTLNVQETGSKQTTRNPTPTETGVPTGVGRRP
jgi:hypothetical protein